MRIAFIVALLLLAGCASAPRDTRNACAIFEQRDGWFNNWQRAANHAERQYGVPVPILMATKVSVLKHRLPVLRDNP